MKNEWTKKNLRRESSGKEEIMKKWKQRQRQKHEKLALWKE